MAQTVFHQVFGPVAFYAYGVFTFFLFMGMAVRSGAFFKRDSEQDRLQFEIARDRFWNLSKSPIPGFQHRFQKLRNGMKLHYICNRPLEQNGGNLVIFLHGFPDSSLMWRHLLQEPDIPKENATLVCVDLPGYGGSDSIAKYDTEVLEALTEFVVAMRDNYLSADENGYSHANTIIVGHDWGCVLAFRLAAEAPNLADRFILTNGPHIELAFANKDRILHSASVIFKQFRQSPTKNFGCLSKSIRALKPLFTQVLLFGYIYAFHLPAFMVKYLGTGGNYSFLRGVQRFAHGQDKGQFKVHESMAAMWGPGPEECKGAAASTQQNGDAHDTYGETVVHRAKSHGECFWNMTAYYRDGVGYVPWRKSLEAIADLYALETELSGSNSPLRRRSSSSNSSALYSEKYKGSLQAPATILWGEKDRACSRAICLDGLGDYLARESEVTLLPRTAHWTPVEIESRAALAKAIKLYADNDAQRVLSVTKAVNEVYTGATMMVRK